MSAQDGARRPRRRKAGNGISFPRYGSGLGGADRLTRPRADRDQRVIGAASPRSSPGPVRSPVRRAAAIRSGPAPRPSRSPPAPPRSPTIARRAPSRGADRAAPPGSAVAVSAAAHSIAAAGNGSPSSGPRLCASSTSAWASWVSVRADKPRLDEIAGNQHRPHAAGPGRRGHRRPAGHVRGVISRTTAPCSPWPSNAQTMAGVSIRISRPGGNNRRSGGPSPC